MKELKVFINEEGRAVFACPKCEKRTAKDISKFKEIDTMVRIKCKCSCGNLYTAVLERRKFYRKNVDLPGNCSMQGNDEPIPIVIKNLSRSGVKFECEKDYNLKPEDIIDISFHLNDGHNTMIKKKSIVKSISGLEIGTEFFSRDMNNPVDKAYELAIGFYTFKLN